MEFPARGSSEPVVARTSWQPWPFQVGIGRKTIAHSGRYPSTLIISDAERHVVTLFHLARMSQRMNSGNPALRHGGGRVGPPVLDGSDTSEQQYSYIIAVLACQFGW